MRYFISLLLLLALVLTAQAQELFPDDDKYDRGDTLRGMLSSERSYDVNYYALSVKIDPDKKTIEGNNLFVFTTTEPIKRFQFDLYDNMKVEKVLYKGREVKFDREFHAVFFTVPVKIPAGVLDTFQVFYSGEPIAAARAPWDGGFDWKKDKNGHHWVGVACEGDGASLWWPCKDHLSDEPDSMLISVAVPSGLMNVSNGRLRKMARDENGFSRYDWFVHYPINTYNVTVNIGKYDHFSETLQGLNGELTLDYFVMPYNMDKAKTQFRQVMPMMKCFEEYLGPYPFYKDGFKLIETPYLGMEHQSAIAYGNDYKIGYAGRDYSRIGLDFDYIIIHETGHEWWGNLVSCTDIADLWIHEGFCTYSEALYVECMFDYKTAMDYVFAKQSSIGNKSPIIGKYLVNEEGAGDMYNKGMLILNTLRHLVEDDELWFNIIKGLGEEFGYQTVNTAQVENYISKQSGKDFTQFFDQYLRESNIPNLEYRINKKGKAYTVEYRWVDVVDGFDMPIPVSIGPMEEGWIFPTTEWKSTPLKGWNKKAVFEVNKRKVYVNATLVK